MRQSCRILENPAGKSRFKGGTGLVSTAADDLRLAQMVANGGVLDGQRHLAEPVVRFMLSNHIVGMGGSTAATTGPDHGLGLGGRLSDGMGTAAGSPNEAMWAAPGAPPSRSTRPGSWARS
jgi:hypothetical protein